MKKILLLLFYAVILPGLAYAGEQDFTLVNATGVEIAELYISPASADDWQEDVLTTDTLPDGEAVNVNFSREENADLWDIKIVDGEGTSVEWSRMKLTEISKVVLAIEDGEPVATFE